MTKIMVSEKFGTGNQAVLCFEERLQIGAGLGIITLSVAGIAAHWLGLSFPGLAQGVSAAAGLVCGYAVGGRGVPRRVN